MQKHFKLDYIKILDIRAAKEAYHLYYSSQNSQKHKEQISDGREDNQLASKLFDKMLEREMIQCYKQNKKST